MDFYFTDRKFNLLGKAITGVGNVNQKSIYVTDDTDAEFAKASVGRSLTATLTFGDGDVHKVMAMAAQGNFVLYKDYRGRSLFMTIMEWTGFNPHNGVLSFVAENGGIDLINETVGAYTATKAMPIADYINRFIADSGFEIGINEISNLTRTLNWDGNGDTSLARIESVATQFDAELDFRFDIDGTAIVKRYIDIYKHIGADKGQRLAVNVQLNSINTTGNIYDIYTSVVAKGDTPEGSNTPLSLAGYKWTDPDGRYVLTTQGVLMDTVANQKWSRLNAGGAIADIKGGYINRVISYTAKSQAELLQSALAGLKKAVEPVVNYEADVVDFPAGVQVGDTVHLVDELQDLNLSTRMLELKTSYSAGTRQATFGDFLIEQSQIDPQLLDIANTMKTLKAQKRYWPWTRYADDDQGTGMSALPAGKKYMAIVWSNKSSVASDDPADYAGKWALIKGTDGANGVPGANGADGRTSYFHTAWADDVSGSVGFTTSGGDGKKYIGTYSDFTLADSVNPADYSWALFKGDDGDVGPKGPQGLPGTNGSDGRTTYAHFAYANSQDGNTDFSTTDSNRKYIGFYSDFTSGDSTNPSAYNWSLIKGTDGADGKDGVPGKPGADGKTPYFHIAYADSGDGNTNFSLDTPGSRKYIGSYTDFTQSDSTNPAAYSWQLVQGPKGDTGKDGVAGKDGVGIKSTQTMYAQSTSGTTAPTTGWTAQVPTLIKGQYLWTQTTWVYTDNTGEAGYTVSYNAKDGNTGANGIAGKDGVGIKTTTITYQSGTSGTVKPTGTWADNPPSVTAGNYLWTRTVWSYTDGTSETGYSVAKMGEKGDQGIKGPAGADGKSSYTHIAYANIKFLCKEKGNFTLSEVSLVRFGSDSRWVYKEFQAGTYTAETTLWGQGDPAVGIEKNAELVSEFSTSDSASRTHIGMYVDFTATDSTKPSDYSWTLVKGTDGANGTPGPAGADGRTPYFHTAYANSADGKDGFYVGGGGTNLIVQSDLKPGYLDRNVGSANGFGADDFKSDNYIATNGETVFTFSSPDYVFKGSGNHTLAMYDSDKNYLGYQLITSATQTLSKSNVAYIRFSINFTNEGGTEWQLSDWLSAHRYKLEKGSVATPWSPAPSEAHPTYMGTYTDYTQADSLDPTAYQWSQIKGEKGDTGASGKDGVAGKPGVGIKSTTITYQASTSGTTAPTGTWVAYPTATAGQYQWTRTVWTYTDGTTEIGYSVGHIGANGANGQDGVAGKPGVGIQSTTITYATSTSGTSAPTSGWVSTPPAATAGQFIWTRTVWTYTDGTSETGYSVGKIGEKGATGNTGATGANGKSVWSYPYDRGANRAGSWWSDLKPAPTTANPPKVGDTLIDLIGNMYQITNVTLGGADEDGGTFDYGSLLTSIKGPQGPAGNDITSYASGIALPTAVAPANSQFWLTDSAGVAIKFYKSTGTAWVEQQISAAAINAATFNGLSFTGVTFNGSTFMSANSRVIADGEEELYTAGTTLTNTQTLDKMGYTSVAQGSIMGDTTPNSFKATTTISNTGSIRSRADFASGDWSIITISPTQSAMTMSNSQGISGTLNADYLSMVNGCGKILWEGVLFMGWSGDAQMVTPSKKITDCLNGWKLIWGEYKNGAFTGTQIRESEISKTSVLKYPGAGRILSLMDYGNANCSKYVYAYADHINGNTKNSDGAAGSVVLVGVYEY